MTNNKHFKHVPVNSTVLDQAEERIKEIILFLRNEGYTDSYLVDDMELIFNILNQEARIGRQLTLSPPSVNGKPYQTNLMNVFRTKQVNHLTDLLVVKMDNGTYTVFKNREGLKWGTVIGEAVYIAMKGRASSPIVLNEHYLEKDEEGRIIY